MKIAIIGSTELAWMMRDYQKKKMREGHIVSMPVFDDAGLSPLEICRMNIEHIQRADHVACFWNGRSMGTWGDWMAALALAKPVNLIYCPMEKETFLYAMKQYHEEGIAN